MHKPIIVGILNTTPDSYWDGGEYVSVEAAVKRAGELISEGADFIDIGGESTGPGSKDVSAEEEINRTIPIIAAIRAQYPDIPLSIDTYKAETADAALQTGVSMVNDITAGRSDPKMFSVLIRHAAKLVLMYAKDNSARTTKKDVQYDDVIKAIKEFLLERIEQALQSGIKKESIIIDPGLGHFVSSDPRYSFEIIAHLPEITALGYPVFISPSRKSFLAGAENLLTKDRLPGTIVASALAVTYGSTYIRTHDVAEVRRGCEIVIALLVK